MPVHGQWLVFLSFIIFAGCKLSEHQEPPRSDMSDSGRHDQGEDTRGDPQDIQHQERLHSWGRRGGSQGECLGIWVKYNPGLHYL